MSEDREQTRLDDIAGDLSGSTTEEGGPEPAGEADTDAESPADGATDRTGATGDDGSEAAADSEEGLAGRSDTASGGPRRVSSTGDIEETVELGVALLATLEGERSLAAIIDRIETVTTDPALTREILDTAQLRGLIEREEGLVRVRSGRSLDLERDVVRREGEFTCRRCGCGLSTGHFIRFEAGEHGPFGSSCIRKVTGRE